MQFRRHLKSKSGSRVPVYRYTENFAASGSASHRWVWLSLKR